MTEASDPKDQGKAYANGPESWILSAALHHLPQGVTLVDANHAEQPIVYCNAGFLALTGYEHHEVIGRNCRFLQGEGSDAVTITTLREQLAAGQAFKGELLNYRKNGDSFWNELSITPLFDMAGSLRFFLGIQNDITTSKSAQQALMDSETLYASLVASLSEGVIVQDGEGTILACNKAAERILGLSIEQLCGQGAIDPSWRTVHEDGSPFPGEMHPAMVTLRTGEVQADIIMGVHKPDGSLVWVSCSAQPLHHLGEAQHYAVVCSFVEITARKMAEDRAHYLAYYDALTGLPNRRLLQDRLARCIEHAHRSQRGFALLFIDLDRFKPINDAYGHRVGDALLREVGQRLKEAMRGEDSICRLGGDEFVILLPETDSSEDVRVVAEKLQEVLGQPFLLDGHSVNTSPSIGVSLYPADGLTLDALLASADTAMYHAKRQGRNNFQFFRPDMSAQELARLELERDLREAVRNGSLHVYYQPQIQLSDYCVVGVEALLRWEHPVRGWISPSVFIPIAEECGLIHMLGEWTLEMACRQNQSWVADGLLNVPVAVNVSALQLSRDWAHRIDRLLHQVGLAPELLEIELTESAVMRDTTEVRALLDALRQLGVRLAIDDFGTGYCSLSYLRRFPIHKLKIDRSFVDDMECNADDKAIAAAIIGLGQTLRLRVLAEGVESEVQMNFLRELGCDEVQGYLVGEPMSSDAFTAILAGKTPMNHQLERRAGQVFCRQFL